jgi:hypothetical protein
MKPSYLQYDLDSPAINFVCEPFANSSKVTCQCFEKRYK